MHDFFTMPSAYSIADALNQVRNRIAAACEASGRDPRTVKLIAVSKTFPAAAIREAWQAGQTAFGESYVQEAVAKIAELADLALEWHFIGPLQSNKTRLVAENFAWVHSVDREKIARRLSEQRPSSLPPLSVCIEVNVSGEASKSGCRPEEAEALCRLVESLPRLKLRGLMTIPAPTPERAEQRAQFAALRRLRDRLQAQGFELDTLSMGMSDDLEAAILEGATIVRVGTAIFGLRQNRRS
ncbi:MAG: YggS family pyridoxal phosphate-dependent enzyme [Rhodocyclaceae bacterium]|nr:YggS family pyridoxal phosphate-dependent enzyme [Rhodocyclaceae bacterium]